MGRELYSQRKEIKYIVPLDKALAVGEQLDRLLQRDEHCMDGPYLVRSLYFDSVNQIDFAEKLAGMELEQVEMFYNMAVHMLDKNT
jgi:hypothetical protein